jgi:alkylation response protein AidB-like acyl-CoA dehydrogenase
VVETPEPLILLVAADHDAISVTSEGSADPASRFARVVVDGLPVEAAAVMKDDEAEETIRALRHDLRIVAAHEMAGIATLLLAMSCDHARQRIQFGRTIGSFQAVQHILAEMVELSETLDNLCEAVIVDSTSSEETGWVGSLIVKAHAARVGPQVALMALQVHGGIGFTEEHDLQLYLKRALFLEDYYGAERNLYRAIGRATLSA